jgi:hypothetical protein
VRERKQPPETLEEAQERMRRDLERLRREFEAGDRMALNEAYVWHGGEAHRWVAEGLYFRLQDELEKSPRGKRFERDFIRWFTYGWLRNKGLSQEDSKSLGGAICGCGGETLYLSYKHYRKERTFPHGIQPEPKGGEAGTPADVLGGPEDHILYQRIRDWYVDSKGKSQKKAEELALNLLTDNRKGPALIDPVWQRGPEGIKFSNLWGSMKQKSRDKVMILARRGRVSVQQVYLDAEKYNVPWVKNLFNPQ